MLTEQEAASIAARELLSRKGVDPVTFEILTTENPDNWSVSFVKRDPQRLGGGYKVLVPKHDGEDVRILRMQ
jgi:hypothetical protein